MAEAIANTKDASTNAIVPVDVIGVAANPQLAAGLAARQVLAIGDGGGAARFATVDASGNLAVNVAAGTLGVTGTLMANVADASQGYTQKINSSGQASTLPTTRSTAVTLQPTVTAAAYSANNCVGGLLTFTNAFGAAQSGVLESVTLSLKTGSVTAGFKLYLFNANPSNTTWTDKASPSINAADVGKLIGPPLSLTAYDNGLGTHTLYGIDGIGRQLSSANTSLYGVLVTTGTPTFASTSDVYITVQILQD
jgi:hypothetical protein